MVSRSDFNVLLDTLTTDLGTAVTAIEAVASGGANLDFQAEADKVNAVINTINTLVTTVAPPPVV